uniref:Uncharacterized protein n=1 Tax=Magallana gigas TaxID=29159 RepID=K1QUE7_MAGGI
MIVNQKPHPVATNLPNGPKQSQSEPGRRDSKVSEPVLLTSTTTTIAPIIIAGTGRTCRKYCFRYRTLSRFTSQEKEEYDALCDRMCQLGRCMTTVCSAECGCPRKLRDNLCEDTMLLLQTLLCLTVFQGILSQYCDITSANKCWSPMTATLGDLIPGPTSSSIPPAVKVYSVCSGLNKVFTCMENKMAACSPDDRLLYDTATSSAMFLCTKGKQGYIDHAKCLFNKSSHQAMNTCTSDAITLIKTLIFSVSDLADLKVMSKELCGLASTVRSCLFDTAQENCGRPAASYLQQYMDATIEPFSKFLSCPPPKLGRPIKAFEPSS